MPGADTAGETAPPFMPLPFKAPDVEVRRDGECVYLTSRTPLPPAPQSIPHLLDERAAGPAQRAAGEDGRARAT